MAGFYENGGDPSNVFTPTAREAAIESKNWAVYPEDSLVPQGNEVDEYSSKHYNAKAQGSATTAATSANNASVSATAAATSAGNASTSETNAATSESNAATSAATATTKAGEASTSASNASGSETNAASSASAASTSASNASTSETNAASSASAASTSASNASTSASNASSSATNASNSETKASEWADKAEDSPVETGPDRFSAFHWAQKAEAAANPDAIDIAYDNGTSGLAATNVQGAIDEVVAETGATVTSTGSNANGTWRVWSDGTIEQWLLAQTNINGTQTNAWPTAFLTQVDTVLVAPAYTANGSFGLVLRNDLTTLTNYTIWANANATHNVYAKGK